MREVQSFRAFVAVRRQIAGHSVLPGGCCDEAGLILVVSTTKRRARVGKRRPLPERSGVGVMLGRRRQARSCGGAMVEACMSMSCF